MSRCVIDVQGLRYVYGEGGLQVQVALAGVDLTVNAGSAERRFPCVIPWWRCLRV